MPEEVTGSTDSWLVLDSVQKLIAVRYADVEDAGNGQWHGSDNGVEYPVDDLGSDLV